MSEEVYEILEDGKIKVTFSQETDMMAGTRVAGKSKSNYEYIATPEELEENLEERQKTLNNLQTAYRAAQKKRDDLGKSVKLSPRQKVLQRDVARIGLFEQQFTGDRAVDETLGNYNREFEKCNRVADAIKAAQEVKK